jgi:hypothetical protein
MVLKNRKRRRIAAVLLIAFCCVCMGLYPLVAALNGTLNSKWYPWKVRASKTRGNALIAAIDAYKRDHNRYPDTLDDLVPRYVSKIEQPTAGGERWDYYSEYSGSTFTLAFEDDRASVPRWYYRPDLHRWVFKSF